MSIDLPLLVFGGSGQVGSAILGEAERRGIAAHSPAWDGSVETFDALCARARHGIVVYAAGKTHVDRCELEPAECQQANCVVPGALAARSAGRMRFVYFSTDYVFDGRDGPYAEDAATAPLSEYGRNKAAGERAVLSADPRALVVRTTGVYGPEPQEKNFVAQVRRRLGSGERMLVASDQVATPTYNVDLAARTLDLVLRGEHGLWHVAGPELIDRHAFACVAAEVFGLDASLLEAVPTAALGQAAPRPLRGGLRIDKLEAALGPHATRGPRDGLAAYALAVA